MVETIEELKKASEEEKLAMAAESAGATTRENFKKRFPKTKFSYSAITTELMKLGYVSGFYHPKWKAAYDAASSGEKKSEKVEIAINSDEKRDRYNLSVTESTKKRYEAFLKDKNFPFKHTSAALELYMDAVENGTVKVTLE